MKTLLAAVFLSWLTGCANMSQEQLDGMQSVLQNYQNNMQAQRQPPMQMMMPRTTNCTTYPSGNGYSTTCR